MTTDETYDFKLKRRIVTCFWCDEEFTCFQCLGYHSAKKHPELTPRWR